MQRIVSFLVVAVFGASLAHAGSIDLHVNHFEPPIGSPPGEVPSSLVVNHLLIDFTDDGDPPGTPPQITGQQLIVKLTRGAIYVDSGSFVIPPISVGQDPNPFPHGFFSGVGIGGHSALIVGGAANLPGGQSQFVLNSTEINAGWAPGSGDPVPPQMSVLTAQVTLTPNAQGTWWYFSATADGTTRAYNDLRIENGVMLLVPEPAGAMLAATARAVAAATRRGRRTL